MEVLNCFIHVIIDHTVHQAYIFFNGGINIRVVFSQQVAGISITIAGFK